MLIKNITGNQKADSAINAAVVILGTGAILIGARKIYNDFELAYKSGQINKTKVYNGVPVDVGGVAAQIYDDFYNAYWISFIKGWEDRTAAINTIQSVPPESVPDIANAYYNLFGKIMKADFIRFLSADDYAGISYLFT